MRAKCGHYVTGDKPGKLAGCPECKRCEQCCTCSRHQQPRPDFSTMRLEEFRQFNERCYAAVKRGYNSMRRAGYVLVPIHGNSGPAKWVRKQEA